MSTGIISWIRTICPIVVGSLASWLLTLGVELDPVAKNGLIVGLTGLLIAAYYTLARLLEKKFPWVGVLLGVAQTPDSYSKGETPSPDAVASVQAVDAPIADRGNGTPIFDEVTSGIVVD